MKNFIIKILLFFGIVAVVDVAVGKVFWYLQSTKAGGRTGAEYYICKESKEDMIIMGSSRASHHYVPQIFTDILELSCSNAGQDGNGIVLQYGRWKMISKRYVPKLIVYDVTADFDLYVNDNIRYIDRLKPYCEDKQVRDYVSKIFPIERLKLTSRMYCYNYKFLEVLSDLRLGRKIDQKGYIPLYGYIRDEVVSQDVDYLTGANDFVKQTCIKNLINEVRDKGGNIVFVISPYWRNVKYDFCALKDIAAEMDVPILDYSENTTFNNKALYKDSHHLNEEGAKVFSKLLANNLKQIIDMKTLQR